MNSRTFSITALNEVRYFHTLSLHFIIREREKKMHRITECSMLKKLLAETYLDAHEASMIKPHRLTIFAEKLLYRCLLESQIPLDLGMILGRFLFPTSSPEKFFKKSSFSPSSYSAGDEVI